jgi:hypothetical protein
MLLTPHSVSPSISLGSKLFLKSPFVSHGATALSYWRQARKVRKDTCVENPSGFQCAYRSTAPDLGPKSHLLQERSMQNNTCSPEPVVVQPRQNWTDKRAAFGLSRMLSVSSFKSIPPCRSLYRITPCWCGAPPRNCKSKPHTKALTATVEQTGADLCGRSADSHVPNHGACAGRA